MASRKLETSIIQEAERLEFWGYLVPDAYMWDTEALGIESDRGIDSTLEPWVALADLAARTTRIMLGTFVTPLPLRPPQVVAKTVATLDNLSEGRVVLGIGAGATERMFRGYATWDDPLTRARKAREGLELVLRLWTTPGPLDFRGEYYHVEGAVLDPKPTQKPHPPLLFGGAGRIMLELAGKYADICYIPPWTKVTRIEAKQVILESAKKSGRSGRIEFASGFDYSPTDGVIPPKYDYRVYLQRVEEAKRNGCNYFMMPLRYHLSPPWLLEASQVPEETRRTLDVLRQFARDIVPSFD